jgi:hypothetical protein
VGDIRLREILDAARPVLQKWSSKIRTSTCATLMKNAGGEQAGEAYLQTLQTEIETATAAIEEPLGVLVGMHNTMLKKLTPDTVTRKEGTKKTPLPKVAA